MLDELRAQLRLCSHQEDEFRRILEERDQRTISMNQKAVQLRREALETKENTKRVQDAMQVLAATVALGDRLPAEASKLAAAVVACAEADDTSKALLDDIRRVQRTAALQSAAATTLQCNLLAAADTLAKFALQCEALREGAEVRVGATAAAIPDALDAIFHDRELAVRDACNTAEYRLEESDRLDRDILQLEQRAEGDSAARLREATLQQETLAHAFAVERRRLGKELARQQAQDRELAFHVKRGTQAKRATQLTAQEEALQRRGQQVGDEVAQLRATRLSIEAEIAQVSLQASSCLQELSGRRLRHKEVHAAVLAEHTKHRRFLHDLREEQAQWLATKGEMAACVRETLRHREGVD